MNIRDFVRNSAVADVFSLMSSEDRSKTAIDEIKSMPDAKIDLMGKLHNVPDNQLAIFRSIVRGEENPIFEKLKEFEHELRTGDLILVTGKSPTSKALVASQKPFYLNAKSSHIAVVHADFICIDAMPGAGVSNRLVSEILADVEDEWRIIRFNGLNDAHGELLQKRCAHYIAQPYKITLKRKRGKDYSYCSELARKVYEDCEIAATDIPPHVVVKPCDFDRIADSSEAWADVTENVKPYIEFAIEYAPLLKVISKLFIDGLKLNRARYEERRQLLRMIDAAEGKEKMRPEKATLLREKIREIESSMSFTFWDFRKSGTSDSGAQVSISKSD